jgi:hypothetical protein
VLAPYVMATVHPSSLLRAPDSETREREMVRFVADLSLVAEVLRNQGRRPAAASHPPDQPPR